MPRRTPKAPVYRVTGARRSLSEDIQGRQRRYLVSMAIRTGCLLLAIVTHGWLRFVFLAAAVGLPYIAVVMANGGREPDRSGPALVTDRRLEIGADQPPPAVPDGSTDGLNRR